MDNFSTLRKCLVYEICWTGTSLTIAKSVIRLHSRKAILHVLGLLHNNQAYTNAIQFIQTSTSLPTLTLDSFDSW